MSTLRRLVIDTDTGSDDVWAIIAALRATDTVKVEAITAVCGNLPLELCVKNAMLAVDAAGTYTPPVYRGSYRPILNVRPFHAEECHGADGLSGMNLPASPRPVENRHGVDALTDLVLANPGEIEIATCGPLTNIALACLRDERFAPNVKKMYILGGSVHGAGNMTPAAEYNIFVDPEAASVVLNSGIDATWVTWDNSLGDAEINAEDVRRLRRSRDPAARFCERCTRQLHEYHRKRYGRDTFGVIDSVLMACTLHPEIMKDVFHARCTIGLSSGERHGAFLIDREAPDPNAAVCAFIDTGLYKQTLFSLYGAC